MELRSDEVMIYYGGGKINGRLEAALGRVLAEQGYARWATSTDGATGVRRLRFDKEMMTQRREFLGVGMGDIGIR